MSLTLKKYVAVGAVASVPLMKWNSANGFEGVAWVPGVPCVHPLESRPFTSLPPFQFLIYELTQGHEEHARKVVESASKYQVPGTQEIMDSFLAKGSSSSARLTEARQQPTCPDFFNGSARCQLAPLNNS